MKEGWYCAKCNVEMEPCVVPRYEYVVGIPLDNVQAMQCPKCENVFFTEEQAHAMRDRTEEIKKRDFSFPRKVTISGKSLVVGIPAALAEHLHIKKGQKVRILPSSNGFFVQKA